VLYAVETRLLTENRQNVMHSSDLPVIKLTYYTRIFNIERKQRNKHDMFVCKYIRS